MIGAVEFMVTLCGWIYGFVVADMAWAQIYAGPSQSKRSSGFERGLLAGKFLKHGDRK